MGEPGNKGSEFFPLIGIVKLLRESRGDFDFLGLVSPVLFLEGMSGPADGRMGSGFFLTDPFLCLNEN